MVAGGPVPVWQKYTTGSKGIWEKIRQTLVLVPNRSSGNPYVPLYRVPPPGTQPGAKVYEDPVTIPSGDIVSNVYYKRDHRRNYPQTSSFDQTQISGLLKLGNVTEPRVSIGTKGEQELSLYKDNKVYLSDSLKTLDSSVFNGQILGTSGEPVLAPNLNKGKTYKLVHDHGMYAEDYPCRIFT